MEVVVEERPPSGPGRPSQPRPRVVKAVQSGRQGTRHERAEGMARKRPETGGCVRLTPVPTAGARAHRAGDVLRVDKEPQGSAQHFAFLQAPVMVHSLFLKKPERIAALGLVLWLALRIWRWRERALRLPVETTGTGWPGWDKKETTRPTAFMLLPKVAAVMVRKGGPQRQLGQALSAGPQPSLAALGVPPTCCTASPGGQGASEGKRTSCWARQPRVPWLPRERQQTRGVTARRPQAPGRALEGAKANLSALAARPGQPGGSSLGQAATRTAGSAALTLGGQNAVALCAERCDEGIRETETRTCTAEMV